ncbi:glycosyl hydrolase family 43 [Dyadobacter jejuensis]|uniref:Glycosyl hydrolase family 43 n=2 Tax=Dyadobacter jejuensis TaxID=1082580 RepID=A0A316AKN0_9BACT|nr:glycosyl hydrolase family 43 [Dyadobacter jejuensis]
MKLIKTICGMLILALVGSVDISLAQSQQKGYALKLGKVPMSAKFVNDTMSIWGASLIKGGDGLYHLYYSQWKKSLGWAWVTDSEIAHAVSKSPFGPFTFQDVFLPKRGDEYWDGLCTHNPTIHRFGGKYYLYYMGNTGDGVVTGTPGKEALNWTHRNNQRIGVAVADNPNGPWERYDQPLIDNSSDSLAIDALMTSNPSMTQRPDGTYLFIYKGVGMHYPLPGGGPVLHCVATSDSPVGPIKKYDVPIFEVKGERFPAEDPYIWYEENRYRAIVKKISNAKDPVTGKMIRGFSLVLYESADGFDRKLAEDYLISDRTITWENGHSERLVHLERPQVFFEDGRPTVLLCAADFLDANGVRQSFNLQIPLIRK